MIGLLESIEYPEISHRVILLGNMNISHRNPQIGHHFSYISYILAGADPGFPIGMRGADVRCGRFLAKMYAKSKELGVLSGGGVVWGFRDRPLGSAYVLAIRIFVILVIILGGSNGVSPVHAPKTGPISFFFAYILPKSARVGGRCPLAGNLGSATDHAKCLSDVKMLRKLLEQNMILLMIRHDYWHR